MSEVIDRIEQLGVVPVVVIEEPADAPDLVAALHDGGLPVAEFTFRTAAAEAAIRAAAGARPDVLVGAGSVVMPEQVDVAVGAGARFIVSPGIHEDVVVRAHQLGVPAIPGCATPSDLMRARQLELGIVKFFPAEALGGLAMLQAVAAPFPGIRFVPTGGIDAGNMGTYLRDRRVAAVGGSWMVKPSLLAAREWTEVARLAREAVAVAAAHRAE
jgi:2-dehydro-3-deoxyphosphogluconate aldolase/(4S)-4-hydroxy-2-oxoglutarate aldolase